jgi:hypothetical protein
MISIEGILPATLRDDYIPNQSYWKTLEGKKLTSQKMSVVVFIRASHAQTAPHLFIEKR